MVTKKIPSVAPWYIAGLTWIIYACIFPLYRWYDFLLIAGISVAAWFLARNIFPGQEVQVEAPVDTGSQELDEIICRGRDAVKQMRKLNDEIKNPTLSSQIDEMESISAKIFEFLEKNPNHISNVRTFMNYYLPTGIKLLSTYSDLEKQGVGGGNISDSLGKIEEVMGTVVEAFRKELDGLFEGTALDVAVEVRTLNTMMSNHGIHIE